METRVFGRTGMRLSVLGFGCGAVGGLMVRGDPLNQERTVARAIDGGVNYFDTVAKSLEGSLARLRLARVDIFHLHNAITETGGGEALNVRQVLGDVVPAFEQLRQQGKTRFLGLTAIGDTAALHQVFDARAFDSAQVGYTML